MLHYLVCYYYISRDVNNNNNKLYTLISRVRPCSRGFTYDNTILKVTWLDKTELDKLERTFVLLHVMSSREVTLSRVMSYYVEQYRKQHIIVH